MCQSLYCLYSISTSSIRLCLTLFPMLFLCLYYCDIPCMLWLKPLCMPLVMSRGSYRSKCSYRDSDRRACLNRVSRRNNFIVIIAIVAIVAIVVAIAFITSLIFSNLSDRWIWKLVTRRRNKVVYRFNQSNWSNKTLLSPLFYNSYYVYLYRFSLMILLLLLIHCTPFKELLRAGLILSLSSFSIMLSLSLYASSVLPIFFYSFYTCISAFAIRFKEDI